MRIWSNLEICPNANALKNRQIDSDEIGVKPGHVFMSSNVILSLFSTSLFSHLSLTHLVSLL